MKKLFAFVKLAAAFGVQAVKVHFAPKGRCSVCGEEELTHDGIIGPHIGKKPGFECSGSGWPKKV